LDESLALYLGRAKAIEPAFLILRSKKKSKFLTIVFGVKIHNFVKMEQKDFVQLEKALNFEEIWEFWEVKAVYYDHLLVHISEEFEMSVVTKLKLGNLEASLEQHELEWRKIEAQYEKKAKVLKTKEKLQTPDLWKPEIQFEKLARILWDPSEANEFASRNMIIDRAVEEITSIRKKIDKLYLRVLQNQCIDGEGSFSFSRNYRVIQKKKKTFPLNYSATKRNITKRYNSKLPHALNNLLRVLCYPEEYISTTNHDAKMQVELLDEAFQKINFLRKRRDALLNRFRGKLLCFSLL
jgi:hypothetical protein